jgi:hypothetical protein
MIAKIIPLSTEPVNDRAGYCVSSLRYYQWLFDNAKRIADKKEVRLQDVFAEEIKICEEMIGLLPSKINRIHYMGESALSLSM